MKKILLAAAAVVIMAAPAMAKTTCLRTILIRSTNSPDAHTLLFHMTDGTTWKNTLRNSCPSLRFNGFVYEPTSNSQICENLQTIRVLDSGEACLLGKFSKVESKTPAPHTSY